MYKIAPQFIRDYLVEKFSTIGRISANGEEFVMESLFLEHDPQRHMSINIYSGLWQCFKTGESGNFTRLYAISEEISYRAAYKKLLISNFQSLGEDIQEEEADKRTFAELDLSSLEPIKLDSCYSDNKTMVDAWNLLFSRKLLDLNEKHDFHYFLCKEGKFANRIIIPFIEENTLIFYQARAIYDQKPKYLNPDVTEAPPKSDVLFPFDWEEDHVVLCEGVTDAISLRLQGINATSMQGKNISHAQLDILSDFKGKIILGLDNDESGWYGVNEYERLRKEKRMEAPYICPPPSEFKDWNKAHEKGFNLFDYVKESTVKYSFDVQITMKLSMD